MVGGSEEPADAPESRPASNPERREAEFTFEGRSIAEIMAEFKDVADAEGGWSVSQIRPSLFNLYSFVTAESSLVIKRYVEDFHEQYLSPAGRAEYPDNNPDLAAWPAHEAWMRGALDLYMQLDRKWNGVAGNLRNKEWTSGHTPEEISEAEFRQNRLAHFKRELSREIDRREVKMLGKKADSAPVSDH